MITVTGHKLANCGGVVGKIYGWISAPWLAVCTICALQVGVAFNGLIEMLSAGSSGVAIGVWVVALPILVVLQVLHSPPGVKKIRRFSLWSLHLQALLTYVPSVAIGVMWPGMGGFIAGAAAGVLRGWRGTGAFLGVLLVDLAVSRRNGLSYTESAVAGAVTLTVGLAVTALVRLACRLAWMHRSEDQAVRSALQDERLRIGRDMHDLLASRLAYATIRGELANRYLGNQNERARSELNSLVGLTREVLVDMRSMAHEFGVLSFRNELENAQSLLRSVDVDVAVNEEATVLPVEIQNFFATVVRESVANILRHSEATLCTVSVRRKGDVFVLSVLNNGVRDAHDVVAPESGRGLSNLALRAAELGGRCRAWAPSVGHFELIASCPVKPPSLRLGAAIPLPGRCVQRRDDFEHRVL